jgi:uncharacterized protein YPO0396
LDLAFRAMRAGAATSDQIAAIAQALSSSIDASDDTCDALLAALGGADPDAADDAEDLQTNAASDPDEVRIYLERLATARARSRNIAA